MLKFDDAERTCQRMLQEASTPYRYDSTRQVRLAKEILDDIAAERQKGLMHGMLGGIAGLKNRLDLNGRTGISEVPGGASALRYRSALTWLHTSETQRETKIR